MNHQPPTDSPASSLSPHRPLHEFYPAPAERQNFVNELFNEAAPDYDWVNGVMSFWSDKRYRRQALSRAGLRPGMRMLDVATGTGLMIKAALELGLDPTLVTGVDPSRGMLEQNRQRNPVTLLEGCGECLPCPDSSFDFVCMGYALRHVEDLSRLFGEFRRVLRPNGRVLILELTRPANPLALWLMRSYIQRLLPMLGWLRRQNRSTAKLWKYYWATIAECVPPSVIMSALQVQGFHDVRHTTTSSVLSEFVASS